MDKPTNPGTRSRQRLPDWLRIKVGKQAQSQATRQVIERFGLNTVCTSACCPNIGECYAHHTATFLILGRHCTRDCRFCAIANGPPEPVDADEPHRLAQAAEHLGLRYVVITSVTRDDLPDGGAEHFARCIRAVRERIPGAQVEVLTPDFGGEEAPLATALSAGAAVFNHNVETVPRLQKAVRPQADYHRSVSVLVSAGQIAPEIPRKSGLMVGLGETDEEIRQTLEELGRSGISIVTLGQYLQPTRRHWPVDRYVPPEQFDTYARWAKQAGIAYVAAGPFVRSSYRAAEAADAVRHLPLPGRVGNSL